MYPAHAAGVEARYVFVRDGIRLRVVESGPAAGPLVLLVHGWGASAYSYRDALPAFAGAGFRAVAVDLPGHGLSDKPAGLDVYTRDGMTATIGALLDALDARDATVVGVSMGGAIALQLAVVHHPRVRRVALINPVGLARVRFTRAARTFAPLALRKSASVFVTRTLVRWLLQLAYLDRSRVSARDVDEYWAAASQPGFAAAATACLHQFSWTPYTEAELAAIECPTLVVIGTRDHLITGSESRVRTIARSRVVRVSGGHAVNEACPAGVNAVLLVFARE